MIWGLLPPANNAREACVHLSCSNPQDPSLGEGTHLDQLECDSATISLNLCLAIKRRNRPGPLLKEVSFQQDMVYTCLNDGLTQPCRLTSTGQWNDYPTRSAIGRLAQQEGVSAPRHRRRVPTELCVRSECRILMFLMRKIMDKNLGLRNRARYPWHMRLYTLCIMCETAPPTDRDTWPLVIGPTLASLQKSQQRRELMNPKLTFDIFPESPSTPDPKGVDQEPQKHLDPA